MRTSLKSCLALLGGFATSVQAFEDKKQDADDVLPPLNQDNCDKGNKFYVDELPGFRTDTEDWPCSYAGQISSSPDNPSHKIFFYMFPTSSEDANAPAIIWLSGGPGASSISTNFLFSGPLRIGEDADGTFDMYTVKENWTNVGTVIYID